jgi:iron complex outermembrane receptor protein
MQSAHILPPRTRYRPLALALAAAVALVAPAVGFADPAPAPAALSVRSYAIPAGPLTAALNRFADEAGIFLAGNARLTDGKRSAGLEGRFTVPDALNRLLAGSGVEAVPQADGSYALRALPAGQSVVLPAVRVAADGDAGASPEPYAGGQVARGGRLGLLGNTDVLNAPFNITSYTAQTLEDQQARSIADVLANEPSAQLSSARNNINEDFALRGFAIASQDVALNGMYGLTPYFRVPVEMAERVEVLKGPSALLNGMAPSGSVAGAINVVPKRAGAEPLTRVGITWLSDSVVGAQVDAGRRFGEGQQFGVRFNGAQRDGDTPIDEQSLEESVAALALDYRGERLRLSLDAIYQRQDIENVVRQFQLAPTVTRIPDAPDNTTNYPGFGQSDMRDTTLALRGEYDINEHLSAYAGYGERDSSMDALAGNPVILDDAGDYTAAPAWQLYDVASHSSEAGLRAAFSTGPVGHSLSLGATRLTQNADIRFHFTQFPPRLSNLHHPVYAGTPSTAGLATGTPKYTAMTLTSYAIADTLAFFDDRVELTLGARRQRVEAQNFATNDGSPATEPYDESATTPLVGVVFKPWQQVSLYANYIEGLSPGAMPPIGSAPASMPPPVETKQREFGVKADWGRFTTTASAFEIRRPDVTGTSRQRHRGLELNLFGELAPGLRLLGGGSYVDAELAGTPGGAFDGNDAVAVPREQVNLGAEWDTGFAPGLTLSARLIYTGKQYLDQANALSIPDWTRLDVGARYRLAFFEQPVTLRANVENLFDEDYWGASTFGYLHLGTPRTLQFSATVDF